MSKESNYLVNKKLNIKQTLLANCFYFAFLLLPICFYVMGVEMAKTIEEPYAQSMALIFSMYFVMKMMFWLGTPEFIYDEELINKKNKVKK